MANAFALNVGLGSGAETGEIDLAYLWDAGVAERLDVWREACREELEEEAATF